MVLLPRRTLPAALALASVLATVAPLTAACDRNTEPFVPGEEPREPDLSRIFPETDELGRPIALPERAASEEPSRLALQRSPEEVPPIAGSVRVAEELRGAVPEGGVLFVIARNAESGPPLAVRRVESPRFPLEFRIGPGDVMIPTLSFGGVISLEARLDADGSATSRSPGDLVGKAVGSYAPGARGVVIVLDRRL